MKILRKYLLSIMLLLGCFCLSVKAAEDLSYMINDNHPVFSQEELTSSEALIFGELDELGRCTGCTALIGPETLAAEERSEIGDIKPTGWVQNKYEGIVASDPPYLYNRCHLIGFQFLGNISNDERNLITGTRTFNTEAMLPYEIQIADYIAESGHHVFYRVTPVFEGSNLLADGVQMEAQSIEDDELSFAVFARNVQPGILIDYATGENQLDPSYTGTPSITIVSEDTETSSLATSAAYVLNTNTKRFHYPDCPSVDQMKEKNRQYSNESRDALMDQGYTPCGNCRP